MTTSSHAESILQATPGGACSAAVESAPPPQSTSRRSSGTVGVGASAGRALRGIDGGAAPARGRRTRVDDGPADPATDAESTDLPDPRPLVTNLARCVVEILAGAREIEQIARWVNDEVYRHLLKRVVLATRARSARGTSAERPRFSVGAVRLTRPSDDVVEAVVVMHGRARSRAVAVRLETMGTRWRATAIHVL
ncbi:Rv3235 family protein [Frondihabitans australicus]|uniref:3-hydroxyacyl-CoA dehydrogenase n=1 Tax=Frondihabitans australicus TaxID=386892 RepID=A0A495IBI0_9MICO|nr:Rv3235 family protein [Frondihabitans australicus]RKR73279.1 hypothetical protein C8E83_0369 [Frondihabitans australicus]